MSVDSVLLQNLIDGAPATIGVYGKTIVLEPRLYAIDEPLKIRRPIVLRGDNTAIQVTSPDVTAIEIFQEAAYVRLEQLYFTGPGDEGSFPEHGGIALDVRAGRVIIDNCHFARWRIALFLHSLSEDGQTEGIGNADGFMVRDCEITESISGLWALGYDAQTGTVMNCRFTNCRRAITEQSAFGNHYISNYINSCPMPSDPKVADGYGILSTSESTFTSVWLETGVAARITTGCVVGGNMPNSVRAGDRIGLGVCALRFRGGCNNPEDYLYVGGDGPSVMRAPPNGAIAFLQRNSDVYSYAAVSYCSADPTKPDGACPTPAEQGWRLRDGSTTYPCKS